MCVEKLARVIEVDQEGLSADAIVEGRVRQIALVALAPEDQKVRPGDWLLVHTGVALERLTENEARRRVDFMRQVQAAEQDHG